MGSAPRFRFGVAAGGIFCVGFFGFAAGRAPQARLSVANFELLHVGNRASRGLTKLYKTDFFYQH